ncbi:hypothetical protein SCLCIDRAFT_137469 [Scleroderma citrinum Foug A]|uniref:Uncharacterized protein n=1 Tax=Scleroderma citrinum Foug A TaxID=1036808 RepID=A0A0C3DCJ1_9AGAM|nr:hypothetical protein SCLCIDRAFT_137469 [Scleroderma citrinum Foug A]
MRDLLFPKLVACFSEQEVIAELDESSTKKEPFECIHFSWYNRYTIQANDAPEDTHPYMLRHANGSCVNITQMIPYQCHNIETYGQLYDNIVIGFKDVFTWIQEMFKTHLPLEFRVIVEAIGTLPGASPCPFSPMASLVVNINVRTEAHRDVFDKELCLVMPVGEFSGGELVMVEQGLVFLLRNGDVMLF